MPRISQYILPNFDAQLMVLVPALHVQAKRLCRNDDAAEDLVQDTILRALSQRIHFRPGTSLRAWTFTILRNLFYAQWHRQKRMVPWEPRLEESMVVSGGQEDAVALNQISDEIDALPVLQRNAIALVGVGGCSYDEAAKIGDCAAGTMKSRVSRARIALLTRTNCRHRRAQSGFAALLCLYADAVSATQAANDTGDAARLVV